MGWKEQSRRYEYGDQRDRIERSPYPASKDGRCRQHGQLPFISLSPRAQCSVTSAPRPILTAIAAFDRFYFSLHFKHKRNLPACDVQFVPNVDARWFVAPFEKYRRFRRIAAFARQNSALTDRILASQSHREE